jgi:hypothetical protein
MKKRSKISKQSNVQEPDVRYGFDQHQGISGKITFSSHEQEDEERRRYCASLTPIERMRNLYELICLSYGLNTEELLNPKLDNRIIIDDPDEHFS